MVELSEKWFAGMYALTVDYDVPFQLNHDSKPGDNEKVKESPNGSNGRLGVGRGVVSLQPVLAVDAERQIGHVVVLATKAVQLKKPASLPTHFQRSEPRTVSQINARDLNSVVFCYLSSSSDYNVAIPAEVHDQYDLLPADSLLTRIRTVVSVDENKKPDYSVTHVHTKLNVGNKQHLKVTLPAGSEIWSVVVDDKSVVPSKPMRAGQSGTNQPIEILIPLGAASLAGDVAFIDFVYVSPADVDATRSHPKFVGPRFDLPLKNVSWYLYMPADFEYQDFTGTMDWIDEEYSPDALIEYNGDQYEVDVYQTNRRNRQIAEDAQQQGQVLAKRGDQHRAQQAFEAAFHASAFSEDARQQLYTYNNDRALAGLVKSRQRPRQLEAGQAANQQKDTARIGSDEFQRIKGKLNPTDIKNLAMQTSAWTDNQVKAAGKKVQLLVNMPFRGQEILFAKSVQVKPDSPMEVSFKAKQHESENGSNWMWAVGVLIGLGLTLWFAPVVSRGWGRVQTKLAQTHNESRSSSAGIANLDVGQAVDGGQSDDAFDSVDDDDSDDEDAGSVRDVSDKPGASRKSKKKKR
jgi:hypothetical protein